MARDGARAAPPSGVRRRGRVELRLRLTCSVPDPAAGEAWTDFLLRLVRKRRQEEGRGR